MKTVSLAHYPAIVAGRSSEVCSRETIRSPYDGRAVATVSVVGADDMEQALALGSGAARGSGRMPRFERVAILRRIVVGLGAREEELVELMVAESGKPRRFAHLEVQRAIATFSLAADEVTRTAGEVLPLDLGAATVGYTALRRCARSVSSVPSRRLIFR